MSRTREKLPFLLRLYQAQRLLSGRSLDDDSFISAMSGGGGSSPGPGSYLHRLRHPASEVRLKNRSLRGGGRDLAATDPYARQFLRMLDLFVAGPLGTTVSAEIQRPAPDGDGFELDREINAIIDAGWQDWASHPVTTDRRHCLAAAEHLYWRTQANDGDVFVRLFDGYPNRHGLAIQFVDADQIDSELNREAYGRNREIRMGVELDEYGAPVGYWVRDYPDGHGFKYGPKRDPYFVSAYDFRTGRGEMLHAGLAMRANQLRSLSWFSPVLESAEARLRYTDAVLTAALRAAAQPVALEAQAENFSDLQQPPPPPPADGSPEDPSTAEARARYFSPTLEVDPDRIPALPAGWKLASVPNDHPTGNYAPFLKTTLREYAAGLGATYESLANDRESTNYGSLRGGMKLEQKFFQFLQQRGVADFLIPLRLRWLQNSMLQGLATNGAEGIVLPGADWRAYERTSYDPPVQEWIDPVKDIEAVARELELKLTSHTEVARRMGRRWADVAQKIADDQELAKKSGFSLEVPKNNQPQVAAKPADGTADDQADAAANLNGGGDGGQ